MLMRLPCRVSSACTNAMELIQSLPLNPGPDESVVNWHDVLIAHILLHKAEAMLDKK